MAAFYGGKLDTERENKTLTLAELLKKPIIRNKINKNTLSQIAKQSTIFSFWEDVAGKKLSKISKPYKISKEKLFISTKSATVSQQILFIKNKILDKLNTYSKPLGIEFKEISVNYKNFEEITAPKEIPQDEKIVFIEKKELENIKIDEKIVSSIKASISKMQALSEEQKNKLQEKIINSYKAEIYRKNIENV